LQNGNLFLEPLNHIPLAEHYDKLWQEALPRIVREGFEFDSLLDSEKDQRFGITLLIRPETEVKASIQEFLDEVRKADPDQYFYPNSDIHVTVMPIISCYEGFQIKNIQVEEYIHLLKGCLAEISPFHIQFYGITASPSCLMVKGFPSDLTLENIRNKLRLSFRHADLEQSLDKRYPLQTAHSTVVRFRKEVKDPSKILAILDHWKDHDFGSSKVASLELVFNDWYQRKQIVKHLFTFNFG
jgi:2'-5' RNA ligase